MNKEKLNYYNEIFRKMHRFGNVSEISLVILY
jgi:hypothetical protein